jgi:hypothetical protein
MNNRELDRQMATQVSIERKAAKEIIALIILAKKQNLCAELGFKDLADWLIRGHKMSERSAYRKIKTARLSQSVPGVLEKIESGQLSITKAVQVQSAIQTHERFACEKLSVNDKVAIVQKIEKMGAREAEQTLLTIFPELGSEVRATKTTPVTADISRLAINLPNETLDLIKRAQELLSHSIPGGSQAEVIKKVLEDFLNRKDPLRKPQAAAQSGGARRSRAAIRREVMQRSMGKCQFVDHKTKTVCGSTCQVQIDHIKPKAIGGKDEPSNLRCLCRRHNLYMAEVNLGLQAGQWRKH